jgi:phage repressor protein C with HTH and peptisase S24 domain
MSTTIERLNIALKTAFLGKKIFRKGDMATYLGYKSPYFSGIINGKEKLNESFLKCLETKLGINTDWILTGEGSMLMNSTDEISLPRTLVPLVPVAAYGGNLSFFAENERKIGYEKIISPIEGIDFAITIAGDSMAPEFPNGSIVLIKKIDEKAFIEWGKTYVLDTLNGIVVKVLTPSEKDGKIKCVSINRDPIFAPFEVDLADVNGIYAVKFSMTRK